MVGDYPIDPVNVDLSVFHSAEAPKGSGMNYSDGITPFVLAKITQTDGSEAYVMETGYRERQGNSPYFNRVMRFEPRPGYLQLESNRNVGRSPAISNDPRTWPDVWPDRINDPDDPGWSGSWNGYFGKQIVADQESYFVLDDQYYDAWDFYPDSRDSTRKGLGLRIEVHGFQWANPQARNVIFWVYDITNEGTTDYDDNIIFGLYMDSGVGGSALSCDGIFESDDDNAFFDRTFDKDVLNLVYTWDRYGHGRDLNSSCAKTGYLGYAYLETPGESTDGIDNDEDGITDEARDSGPGELLQGKAAIDAYLASHYDLDRFVATYGPLEDLPAYRLEHWWTGDEDMDWTVELQDVGVDGIPDSGDTGEGDGIPTSGEPNFDALDLNESDQIGLTGFKINRIRPGQGNPDQTVDDILFFTTPANWPQRLYEQFSDPDPSVRFGDPIGSNYNIGFLFASGPFKLKAGKTERFSLALAYGANLEELRGTVKTVQQIYDANYRFAVPPPLPTLTAEAGDGYVRLSWNNKAEGAADPVTGEFDFEGYRIYRSTDLNFLDPKVITNATGTDFVGNGRPEKIFDLKNGRRGYSTQIVDGVAYYLGDDTGLQHTWTDTTVTNGQEYFYAIASFDHGSDKLDFYPSESPILGTRTRRGEYILADNVIRIRPNPKSAGYEPAETTGIEHSQGIGVAEVRVEVVNSNLVPNDNIYRISFATPSVDSLRATSYALIDSTGHEILFEGGVDLSGEGSGPVAQGLLPVISTLSTVEIDSARTGFTDGSDTDARPMTSYQIAAPINLKRPGFPDDIVVRFSDSVIDTSLALFPFAPRPANFKVFARGPDGEREMDFRFRDLDLDGTLSQPNEVIDVITYVGSAPTPTWRLELPTDATAPVRPPGDGDVFELVLDRPLAADDVFVFTTKGKVVDLNSEKAKAEFQPYVVPNPYIGSASFEPGRFNVSGRGERRIEFRGVPINCTIRIFTVRGELVQTLHHDGSDAGYVAWNLRTKDNLDVAPGLYVYHVDGGNLGSNIGKFAIIK